MAVQETATSSGKGRSAGRSHTRSGVASVLGHEVSSAIMRGCAVAVLSAWALQPLLSVAQVSPAPSAPGASRPAVGQAPNGVPLVQITTPNAAGVSNNIFSQYNVGSNGLILNNSPGSVPTQLGGYVAGNPYLANGSAHVIVNQVVGGNASQLLGYTEVAGSQAQVVIANPSGIYCNGCGFLNTTRTVLTTGMPMFGGTGSLDAFHVTGGQIQIGSAGFNGGNIDQVDLIARSVRVNGQLWAGKQLNVVTGANDVRYGDLGTHALASDGNSTDVAIDVSQLGGMYAGKIALVGTEAGVGVNSLGTIAAQTGDVSLDINGKVTLAGTTKAAGNVNVKATGDISNTGILYAGRNATVASQGEFDSGGTLAAAGNTTVSAARVTSTGALGAGIDAQGNVGPGGDLTLSANGVVSATGQNSAGGNLAISGSSLNLTGAQTTTGGGVALVAKGAAGDAGNISNVGGMLSAGTALTVSAAGAVSNDHGRVTAAQMTATASSLSNRDGNLTQTGTGSATFDVRVTGGVDNTGGILAANGNNMTIEAGSVGDRNGQIEHSGAGMLSLRTGALDNDNGTIATNGAEAIAADSTTNVGGTLRSGAALNLTTSGDLDNTRGTVQAAGAGTLNAGNVNNTAGRIVSLNSDGLSITASGQIANASGTTAQGAAGGVIGGNGNATIQAAGLTNSGTITIAQGLNAKVTGTLDNS
ncbi:filamentous hemagglutinin N-terminal domain-containing protein, partial [Paraburkholderia sp. T12-10]